MVPDSTQQQQPPRRRLLPRLSEDTSTWVWRVGSFGAALIAGLSVAGAMVREKFYDEMKKTPGFSKLRADSLKEYDHLNEVAQTPEMLARDNATKYRWYRLGRDQIDEPYSAELAKEMEKRFGIVSGGLFKGGILQEAKGVWQRFWLLGRNNKANAVIRGLLITVGTVSGFALLRENNRLWNRLDEMRHQQVQDREEMRDLVSQVSNNQLRMVGNGVDDAQDETKGRAAANDNPVNDNMPSGVRPKHQVHAKEAQHHDRMHESSHHAHQTL